MPDYKQGKIYSLRSHQTNQIYIGSTTQTLAQRFAKHRWEYKERKSKLGKAIEILKYEDVYIELLEKYPCDDKESLLKKEGEYIRNHKECVNKQIAGRTDGEYRQEHKEEMIRHNRQYRAKNKEYLKEYKKLWNINNRDRQTQKRKIYYQNNKEKFIKNTKKYDISDIQKLFV